MSALFHPYLCRERSGRHGDYYEVKKAILSPVGTGAGNYLFRRQRKCGGSFGCGTLRQANTTFPLDPGEVVTIKASYSPFSANVDFGLIAPNGRFYYVTVTDGSVDQSIEITQRGEYTFAVRNNSSYQINVSGYVNY